MAHGFTLLVSRSEYLKGKLFLLKVFFVHNQSEKNDFLFFFSMDGNGQYFFFLKNYELKTPSVEMTCLLVFRTRYKQCGLYYTEPKFSIPLHKG